MQINLNQHIKSFSSDRGKVRWWKELNLKEGLYEFRYNYPLSIEVFRYHKLNEKTSTIDIINLVQKDYNNIYTLEKTDRRYGIWGHELEDLYLEGIHIAGIEVTFGIGS